MINIYRNLSRRIVDDAVKAELTAELNTIGRLNGFSPILLMTDAETIALEYRFIGSYDKVLGPVYECFDKALNLEIADIGLGEFYPVLNAIKRSKVRDYFLALIGKSSFYNIVSTTTIRLPGVVHFMSRFNAIDAEKYNCCRIS